MTREEKELWIDRVNEAMRVERNATIDRVLEVIDRKIGENTGQPETPNDYVIACIDIKAAVYALKGGEQE